jgi:dTDP-4-amino-4,6-dideoxygalactose transaminase
MDFIDLKQQQARIAGNLRGRIDKVLAHGAYILGPEVKELEERLAAFVGARHCVTCASGTDALLLPLMAWGVGPGDAVFTTPFTFIATAEVIALLGATPVFVDIDPVTFNISPAALEKAVLRLKKGKKPSLGSPARLKPRGIIPVDLFGQPADYDAIRDIARRHKLFVLEDAAQSFGAEYKGKKTCSFGDAAATSFFPAKPLGGYGDGGAVFTSDDALADTLRSLRVHGQGKDKYDNVRIGINGRLDTLQAAVLLAKMDVFPEEIGLRQKAAERYTSLLSGLVETPVVAKGRTSVWAQYSVQSDRREAIMERLKSAGIPSVVYYPTPLHRQTVFASLRYSAGDFPVSERTAGRIFSLPMHPYLGVADQEKIAAVVKGGVS